MSNEKQETIADIVSANHQFREVAKMIPHEEVDVSKMETTTPTGNAAKMREALENIANMGEQIDYQLGSSDETVYAFRHERSLAHSISECARTALTAPPRNCDVGTAEEQARRYEELCDSHTCGSRCSGSCCPLYDYDCSPFAWAQMPYEEGGAE